MAVNNNLFAAKTVKEVMKLAHDKNNGLLKKVQDGAASDDEKKKFGLLEQDVILEYFSFTSADIDHFKTDLFLSFADYSLFQENEVKKEL